MFTLYVATATARVTWDSWGKIFWQVARKQLQFLERLTLRGWMLFNSNPSRGSRQPEVNWLFTCSFAEGLATQNIPRGVLSVIKSSALLATLSVSARINRLINFIRRPCPPPRLSATRSRLSTHPADHLRSASAGLV